MLVLDPGRRVASSLVVQVQKELVFYTWQSGTVSKNSDAGTSSVWYRNKAT